MSTKNLIDINMNAMVMEWLISVFNGITFGNIKYMDERIIFLTKNIILKYNEKRPNVINKGNAQLLYCCALILAYKFELEDQYISPKLISDLIYVSGDAFTLKQVLNTEREMFKTLGSNLYMKIEYDIMIEKIYRILGLGKELKIDVHNLEINKLVYKNLLYILSVYFMERFICLDNEYLNNNDVDCCINLAIYVIQKLNIYNDNIKYSSIVNPRIKQIYGTIHSYNLTNYTRCINNYRDNIEIKLDIPIKYYDKTTKALFLNIMNPETIYKIIKT